jgi:methyltransferase (TIGR00027 family)
MQSGTVQVVILGAGLDSRAYQDGMLQEMVKIFEVDHPATQASKMARVKKILGKIPVNVAYVPVDFNDETLDKLTAFGFNRSLRSLFIWEGVTYYLHAEAVDYTLSWVGANAAPGSAIIFDYQYLSAPNLAPTQRNYLYAVLMRLSGEKRAFGIAQGRIGDFLARRGFTHVVEVSAAQLKRLYCTGPNQGRMMPDFYAIVHAEVGKNGDMGQRQDSGNGK